MVKTLCMGALLCGGMNNHYLAAYTSYKLVFSTNDDRVVVQVTEDTPITGFDSQGHSIVLHHWETKELYFKPSDAFDLGIRHARMDIVNDALYKLCRQGKTIDITNALTVIRNALSKAKDCQTAGFWLGGIIAGGSLIISVVADQRQSLAHRVARGCAFGCVCGGIPALIGCLHYQNESAFYARVIRCLMNCSACVARDRQEMIVLLSEIQDLLRESDHLKIPGTQAELFNHVH